MDKILQITEEEIANTGTSWTKNKSFDENGYFVIENLWDPLELYYPVPLQRGQFTYYSKDSLAFHFSPIEDQVNGSVSRYWHPQYREIHSKIRKKIEEKIGRKLYNTYYYDRYYFSGQQLTRHTDRDACEISVTVHIGTNLEGEDADWPIFIKTPDTYSEDKKRIISFGEERSIILKPGDGMLYKGCERPHWRNAMPTPKKKWFKKENKEYYYHQIFFHYVLQDGIRAHCAYDRAR